MVSIIQLPNEALDLDTMWTTWWGKRPSSMPDITDNVRDVNYSLSVDVFNKLLIDDNDFAGEVASLKKFYTAPVHLGRDVSTVSEGTFTNYLKGVREFLGYLYVFEGMEKPKLQVAFLDGPAIVRYLSYRKGVRGNQASSLYSVLCSLKAVTKWSTTRSDDSNGCFLLMATLGVLQKQLYSMTRKVEHPPDLRELQREKKWVPFEKIIAKATTYCVALLKDIKGWKAGNGGAVPQPSMKDAVSIELAGRLNTAVFAVVFCGLLHIGTPRPFLMRSLCVKGASGCDAPVECEVCGEPSCPGNRLVREDSGDFHLRISHHKTAAKIRKGVPPIPISRETNPVAWAVCNELFSWGQATLVDSFGIHSASVSRGRIFRRATDGTVFPLADNTDSGYLYYWGKYVADVLQEPRKDWNLTANTMRRMSVEFFERPRVDSPNALTPDEFEGAAIAMGTSVAMFHQVYAPLHRVKIMGDAMQKVRGRLEKQKTVSVPGVFTWGGSCRMNP